MIDKDTRVIVQGITGRQGRFHTKLMLEYGTRIVAGVTPGKGGEEVYGIPVFNTIEEALEKEEADASIIFVPAEFAKDAALEAIEYLDFVVIITEGIPVHDTMKIREIAKRKGKTVIGPNTPGIINVDNCKLGIMPSNIFKRGNVGIVTRSGTLSYEITLTLTENNIGQSYLIGIGGDFIVCTDFVEILKFYENDPYTDAVVLIGEIGGPLENIAASYIKRMRKPVVAYIAGRFAPKERRLGHAGAIIQREGEDALSKMKILEESGAYVARNIYEIPKILKEIL